MAIDNAARGLALKAITIANAASGGGTTYPEVTTFSALPSAAANTGKDYVVQSTTGTWITLTRKPAGLYRSNGTSWLWLGDTVSTSGDISNVPAGNIASTDVQAALNELDTKKAPTAVFTSSANGLAPLSGGGTVNFLRADGTWVAPTASAAWGSITGTLSSQSDLNTALGLKAPLASPTFTGTVGASTITATGAVTGSNLSGTNTGDQTITLTGAVTGSGTGSFGTTLASSIVGLSNMVNVATASVFYRKTAGTGAPEVQTLATLKTDLGLTGTNSGDQTITLTGPVTGSGTGSFATTITANAVTDAMLAQVATATFKGRITAGTGNLEVLTGTQATTLLDTFTTSLKGLAPASGGGTTNYLRADGTWAAPATGGGSGTVTTVSVTTANGVSGSVTNPTTTPAISLTLGAITPTSVAASSTVTGSNLSGTNTGDGVLAQYTGTSEPSAPASGLLVFDKDLNGWPVLTALGSTNRSFPLNPLIGGRASVGSIVQVPNGTPTTLGGFIASTNPSSIVPAATNQYTAIARAGCNTTATVSTAASLRSSLSPILLRGAAANSGFRFSIAGGMETVGNSNCRWFMGLLASASAPAATFDPATATNFIGIGCSSADTNAQLYHNDATAGAVALDLGASFPGKTAQGGFIEAFFWAAGSSATAINYLVRRLDDLTITPVTGSLTTRIPVAAQMFPHWHINNNATATASVLAAGNAYWETGI